MRTEEVCLTMRAGLGYEVMDSGSGKSAMNVVWKVHCCGQREVPSRMKLEETRDICRALGTRMIPLEFS